MVKQPQPSYSANTVSGNLFYHQRTGETFDNTDVTTVLNTGTTSAAFFADSSLIDANYITTLIIDRPVTYRQTADSNGTTLASSIIVVNINNTVSYNVRRNITLYFKVLPDYQITSTTIYSCALYNLTTLMWDSSSCSRAQYNRTLNGYECMCTHLSTFGLINTPRTLCDNETHVELSNGSCVLSSNAQVCSLRRNYFASDD